MAANTVSLTINDKAKTLRLEEIVTTGSVYTVNITGSAIATGEIFLTCRINGTDTLVAYGSVTNSSATLSTNTAELATVFGNTPVGGVRSFDCVVHRSVTGECENAATGKVQVKFAGGTWSDTTSGAAILYKGPKGDTGATGATGPQGEPGEDGEGVPTGGTAGQILKKKSATDFDTEWANDTSGVSSVAVADGSAQTGAVTIPAATASAFGVVKVDGTTIEAASGVVGVKSGVYVPFGSGGNVYLDQGLIVLGDINTAGNVEVTGSLSVYSGLCVSDLLYIKFGDNEIVYSLAVNNDTANAIHGDGYLAIPGGTIADFSTSSTYAVGNWVVYNHKPWVCHTAVGTAGAWTGTTNWTDMSNVSSLFGIGNPALNAAVAAKVQSICANLNPTTSSLADVINVLKGNN